MASLNKVILIGHLTRDPEVRYTPKGTAVVDLGLAVNSSYKSADGQMKEETCFVDVVVWGAQAENCGKYLKKGRMIGVDGRLQFDQWETKEGDKKSRLRVRGERILFLGSPAGGGGGPRSESDESGEGSGRAPYRKREAAATPSESYDADPMPADDDIPF